MNKTQIHFEHYRGNEEFVKRIYDLMDQCERRHRIVITPFFSPDQIRLCETICGKRITYIKDGGYDGAERCRFAFLPFDHEMTMPIAILKATYASTQGNLSHRDVLGALMHLGIEREKLGDILVQDKTIYIIVDVVIENYIICNLTRIGRNTVQFQHCHEEIENRLKLRYQHYIVASLRLDVIVSALVCVSRRKAQDMILAGRVKVDHVVLEQTSFLCNNNSAISIRGYGRYHFAEVIKRTKKDHYVIDVGVYE